VKAFPTLALAGTVLALAGCGGGSSSESTKAVEPANSDAAPHAAASTESTVAGDSSGGASTEASPAAPSTQRSPTEEEGPRLSSKAKPEVRAPNGAPPKKLVVEELEKGSGVVAKAGDEVGIEYVGVDYRTGKQFDSSWERNELFTFRLGDESTVPGFERGIEGMRVGGRRKLVVPPRLAYGATGIPPKIAPNSTLVFVVDLLEAR
jgi:peptidylprolyl isomerase